MSLSTDRPARLRILTLNGASATTGAAFGLLETTGDLGAPRLRDAVLVEGRGGADRLGMLLAERLDGVGWPPSSLGLIAVVVGPGSFTGLRASLALAHGLALGLAGGPTSVSGKAPQLVGVTVGEAIGPALRAGAASTDRIWCVSQARRDRVFIERPDGSGWSVVASMLDALPAAEGPVLLGGDAEAIVAQHLVDAGVAARRSLLAAPSMPAIAEAALARISGQLPPRAAQPLYVDPPEAKRPTAPEPGWAAG